MANKIMKFINEEFGNVRGISLDGQAWLYAKDVCKVLEIGRVEKALDRLDNDEWRVKESTPPISHNKGTGGFTKRTFLVNEPGFYRLVLSSRTAAAKKFQRWVFHEVLPAIRREDLRLMIREDGKATRLELTDTIKKFLGYLEGRGELDRAPVAWYTAFSNLANKAAGIDKAQRDTLKPLQLLRLQDAEDKIAAALEDGMNQNKSHHDVWLACQEKLNT